MITEDKKKLLESYNQALALYKQRQWANAKKKFQEALKVDPTDGPSKVYVGRCDEYMKNPPASDWDGVFVMTTK